MKNVLVVGAAKPLGFEIVNCLLSKGFSVVATYRQSDPTSLRELANENLKIEQLDLDEKAAATAMIARTDGVIFTPILSVCDSVVEALHNDMPAVFFSSNNVAIDPEASVYAALLKAESAIRHAAPRSTILRPTMIYGYPGDGNLSRLMRFIKRFRFSPMFGSGDALQQPVFYRDLAELAVASLLDGAHHSTSVSVGGPEPLSLVRLHKAVAEAVDVRPFSVSAPIGLVKFAVGALEKIGIKSPLSIAQIERVELDKVPAGESVQLAATSLENGLKSLAASLDAKERGA